MRKEHSSLGLIVSGDVSENGKHAMNVDISGMLSDYPVALAAMLRHQSKKRDKQ